MLEQYFGGDKDKLIKEATKLIHTPEPTFIPVFRTTTADTQVIADIGLDQVYKSKTRIFTARDKKRIFAYRFQKRSRNTIILIHGVASVAYLYNKTAGLLREATGAEVFAIDLRGHGKSEGKSGDVEYIDQYSDDLADIISVIRKEKPKGKIIIAGHSMGGGIALRYAMKKQSSQPDGFLFFAPLLGHNSPAIPQGQSDKDSIEEAFMKIHIERIIGLKMLNEISNHEHDGLPVLFFNLPETVQLRKYSYRANMSMAPDDYAAGLKAVNKPIIVLTGSNDEAFSAEALKKAVLENSSGEVYIVEGTSHNGIRHHQRSFEYIARWFAKL